MNPGQDAGQVHGADRRPAQAVVDDEPGQQQERELQAQPGVPPAQETAEQRDVQQQSKAAGSTSGRACPTMGSAAQTGEGLVPGPRRHTFPADDLSVRLSPNSSRMPITQTGSKVSERTRHPHEDAGRRLIVERRQIPQPRPLAVMRIERPVREGQQGGQERVLHVGQDQVRDQQPGRPPRPAGIRPDHRIPEQSAEPRKQMCCK